MFDKDKSDKNIENNRLGVDFVRSTNDNFDGVNKRNILAKNEFFPALSVNEPDSYKANENVDTPLVKLETKLSNYTNASISRKTRRHAWGDCSYADIITKAIQSSPDKKMTLAQIYEYMINEIPYFAETSCSGSSSGWKNSVRHNLSLHDKFVRIRTPTPRKFSYWTLSPEYTTQIMRNGKPGCTVGGKHKRSRATSVVSKNDFKFVQNLNEKSKNQGFRFNEVSGFMQVNNDGFSLPPNQMMNNSVQNNILENSSSYTVPHNYATREINLGSLYNPNQNLFPETSGGFLPRKNEISSRAFSLPHNMDDNDIFYQNCVAPNIHCIYNENFVENFNNHLSGVAQNCNMCQPNNEVIFENNNFYTSHIPNEFMFQDGQNTQNQQNPLLAANLADQNYFFREHGDQMIYRNNQDIRNINVQNSNSGSLNEPGLMEILGSTQQTEFRSIYQNISLDFSNNQSLPICQNSIARNKFGFIHSQVPYQANFTQDIPQRTLYQSMSLDNANHQMNVNSEQNLNFYNNNYHQQCIQTKPVMESKNNPQDNFDTLFTDHINQQPHQTFISDVNFSPSNQNIVCSNLPDTVFHNNQNSVDIPASATRPENFNTTELFYYDKTPNSTATQHQNNQF